MEKDHLEILLEEMKGLFNLVLEGISVIRHEIHETFQELGKKIDMNTTHLIALGIKLDAIAGRR